ncbi:heme o synthase [Limnoglobus roseus]|uniref:Protoheme IX farnesyltransferase n=1 Tax=Limnoglobus roseus TaxID=2598579 RepID=A0A5C1ABI0_9BACT|nr:heme o synthase [Limnoglobus roseus]QEL15376.1 protoheme IX farnesyltransferase [Limnoglobus roseus]
MPATATLPRTLTAPAMSEVRTRFADYLELTKPKIAMMALVTVAVGYFLGAAPSANIAVLLHTLIGAGLVAAGGSALNHWLERRADSQMHRTLNRPLPGGRMRPAEVFSFGVTLAIVGVVYLLVAVPHSSAAIAAAATGFLYVAVYTPLKRVTAWNTVVGAIPGALPPVIGWCAARGTISADAVCLFAILFVWQLPHFYSIAFLHRTDYARGGMKMLPCVERPDGFWTGVASVATAALLLAVGLTPFFFGSARWLFLVGSALLGVWFLARTVRFAKLRNDRTARSVLRGSLVYLAGVMALLVIDWMLPRYLG